jgi:glycosyltransferase involved in cell wall biosynthesis
MDVFALPSREDPFPLVMLEAATHGLPTVCFAQAGGAPEFVGADAGVVVPYLDVDAFAAACAALRDDPARRTALGLEARRRVGAEHGVETQGPKLLRSIERCLAAA